MNRRLLLVPALLLAAFFAWRHFQPPVGDRELILGELEAMRKAAQNQNVNGVLSRLDKDFKLGGAGKSDLRGQLTAFFFNYRDVSLDLSALDAQPNGDSATSSGSYALRFRSGPGSPEEVQSGTFKASWKKIDGQWKITGVSGIEGLGNAP